jgi:hypothetical protein
MTIAQKSILDRVRSKDGMPVEHTMEYGYVVLPNGAIITPEGTVEDTAGYVVSIPS